MRSTADLVTPKFFKKRGKPTPKQSKILHAKILKIFRENRQLSVTAVAELAGTSPHTAFLVIRKQGYASAAAGRRYNKIRNTGKAKAEENRKNLESILPTIVNGVLADSRTMKPGEVAAKYDIGLDTLEGIKQGRYDRYLACNRANEKIVLCNGSIQLYDEKGYVISGKSSLGALEMSDDHEQLKCHGCGLWFEDLGHHVKSCGYKNATDYKRKHRLKRTAALCNDRIRVERVQRAMQQSFKDKGKMTRVRKGSRLAAGTKKHAGMAEIQNQRRTCPAQIAHDLRTLAGRLHHIPSVSDIKMAGIKIDTLIRKHGSVSKALKTVLGNMPPKPTHRWYSDEQLIQWLKDFYALHKRPPFASDARRGLMVYPLTFAKRFGSMKKALALAGLQSVPRGWGGVRQSVKLRKRAKLQNAPPEMLGKQVRKMHADAPERFKPTKKAG
jgi:hypothetical protein